MTSRFTRPAAVFAALLALACGPCRADVVTALPTGAAIVTQGQFTNVYVYPDPDRETWDQHLATISGGPPLPSYSRAAIDAFTAELMQGWPGYFDPLMQYRTLDGTGISPPVFLGSKVASQACVDAAVKDEVNGVMQWNTLRSLANCHLDGQDPSPQVNLIISPAIKVGPPNYGPASSPEICATSTHAYHAWGVNVPNFAVIPTDLRCNASFRNFTQSLSHEDVEILSDPAGLGYLNGMWRTADDYAHGEIGDLCEPEDGSRENPTQSDAIAYTTYQGYGVARYWSNFDSACVPQMEGPPGTQSDTWVLGAGAPLARLTGSSRDFSLAVDRTAPDAPLAQLRIVVQTGGDDLRGGSGDDASVTVHFRSGDVLTANIGASRQWNNNETHVTGLNLPAGPVRVGDITGITIHKDYDGGFLDCCGDNWNIDKVALIVSYPRLPSVTSVTPSGPCGSDATIVIHGVNLDGGAVTAGTIPLAIVSASSDTITATVPGSLGAGVYEIVLTTAAGNSIQPALSTRTDLFAIGPTVTSISPTQGPLPGGTAVTVSGTCFDAPGLNQNLVQVYFGANVAAKGFDQCASSTQCVVYSPAATDSGQVDVIVDVGGARGAPTAAGRFTYTGPTIARLLPDHGPKTGGTEVEIDGDGFPPYLGTGDNLGLHFGAAATSGLCLGSTVDATTACTTQTPAVAGAGPVQVVATAFGLDSPPSPASLFTYDDYPQIVKFTLPMAGIVAQSGVYLNGNAPPGGAAVAIASNAPEVVRPLSPTVTIAPGGQWADVEVQTFPTPKPRTVTLTASYQGSTGSATLDVAASPPLFIVAPQTFELGATGTVEVSLNVKAPAAGVTVALAFSDPAALAPTPATVRIGPGQYSASFPVTNHRTGKSGWMDITATAASMSATQSIWVSATPVSDPCQHPKTCPRGSYWDSGQCACLHGTPQ